MDLEWRGELIWSEGNFACDCNRADFFAEVAEGVASADTDTPCGDGAYSVHITDTNGNLLYEDDDWRGARGLILAPGE